jgi:hypothetical protein
MPISEKLFAARHVIGSFMEDIREVFTEPVKMTLIIRATEHPDRDVLLTDDDLDAAIAVIAKLRTDPRVKEIPPDIGAVQ